MRRSRFVGIVCASSLVLAACGLDQSGLESFEDGSVADGQQSGDGSSAATDSGGGVDGTMHGDSSTVDANADAGNGGHADSSTSDAPFDAIGAPDAQPCMGTPVNCGPAGNCMSCMTSSQGTKCVANECGCTGAPDCMNSPSGQACLSPGNVCGCNSSTPDCPMGEACNTTTHVCSTSCAGGYTCNGGCCDGTTCQPGTATGACGNTGGTCQPCGGGTPSCMMGTCTAMCGATVACGAGYCCAGMMCAAMGTTHACGGQLCLDCPTTPYGPNCVNDLCQCAVAMDCMNSSSGHLCLSTTVGGTTYSVCGCNGNTDCAGIANCNMHQCQ